MENLSNISTIKEIMERFGFNFSKSLGQNFLVNPGICPKIAEMGGADKKTGVLEIGTGFGVLTHELAKRAKKVVAVELDKRLLPVLDYTLSEHNNIKPPPRRCRYGIFTRLQRKRQQGRLASAGAGEFRYFEEDPEPT